VAGGGHGGGGAALLDWRWKKKGVTGYCWAQRPSGPAASKERKRKNGWACYGCCAEYRKGIGNFVFEFWQLKWVNSNGNLNFE
jgi:hypothetical protein